MAGEPAAEDSDSGRGISSNQMDTLVALLDAMKVEMRNNQKAMESRMTTMERSFATAAVEMKTSVRGPPAPTPAPQPAPVLQPGPVLQPAPVLQPIPSPEQAFLPQTNAEPRPAVMSQPSATFDDWKITHMARFWPDAPKEKGAVFHEGKELMYSDYDLWKEYVYSQAESAPPTRQAKLAAELWTLFRGSALTWYTQQHGEDEKADMRRAWYSYFEYMDTPFGLRMAEAEHWLRVNKYTREDNMKDKNVRTYAQELFRYARAMGHKADQQLLVVLFNSLHDGLKTQAIDPSTIKIWHGPQKETLSSYLEKLDGKARPLGAAMREEGRHRGHSLNVEEDHLDDGDDDANWFERRREGDRTPRPRENFQREGPQRPWTRDWRGGRRQFSERRYGDVREEKQGTSQEPQRGEREGARGDFRGSFREGARGGLRGGFRGSSFNRFPSSFRGRRPMQRYRNFGRPQRRSDGQTFYQAEETLWGEGEEVDREAEKMLSDGWVCLDDGLSECEQDDEQSHFLQLSPDVDEKINISKEKVRKVRFAPPQPSSDDGSEYETAIEALSDAESTSQISDSAPESSEDEGAESTSLVALQEEQVIEANGDPSAPSTGDNRKRTSYVKMEIRADLKADPAGVCFDTGSSTNVVDLEWVKGWAVNPRFKTIPNHTLKGVGGNRTCEQEVEFDFYVAGKVDRTDVNGHFHVRADVLPQLGPKMLIGTDFMDDAAGVEAQDGGIRGQGQRQRTMREGLRWRGPESFPFLFRRPVRSFSFSFS